MLHSLRSRLILASLLWTAGLLMLMHLVSLAWIHMLPRFGGMHLSAPVLAGGLLMAAGLWQARLALRPLFGLRKRVNAVRSGEAPRIEGAYPSEVQPLVESLNALLDDREKSVRRAQAAAGDLAHALKTPLALLAREGGGIQQLVERMSAQVDYHLTRSRLAASNAGGGGPDCVLEPCAAGLIRAISKLYSAKALHFHCLIPADLAVRARHEDVEEMLGNLLDNASKWARSTVSIRAAREGARVLIHVEDDGPGLPPERRSAMLERGARLDESAPGSGLGLSIVRDLAEHYQGSVALEQAPLGGLAAILNLPLSLSRIAKSTKPPG